MRQNPSEADMAETRDQPIYWFALLDSAIESGDFEQAAEAVKQLKRLGISVRYRCRSKARKEADK
jgi:hypothetical protein